MDAATESTCDSLSITPSALILTLEVIFISSLNFPLGCIPYW
jgi:hypothetical protein